MRNNLPSIYYLLITLKLLFTEIYCKEPIVMETPIVKIDLASEIVITGRQINLFCKVTQYKECYLLNWIGPKDSYIESQERIEINSSRCSESLNTLLIHNVTTEDSGTYICELVDNNNNTYKDSRNITVLDPEESHINVTLKSGINKLNVEAGTPSVMWIINIDARLNVTLLWKNNKGKKIDIVNPKYDITVKQNSVTFKILQITLNDFGIYQLTASNGIENKTLNLTLQVEDKPVVKIESTDYHLLGKSSQLKCYVSGYPVPKVEWWFTSCSRCRPYQITDNIKNEISELQVTSTINILANNTGQIKCVAYNKLGNSSMIKDFYITDVAEGFDGFEFWKENDTVTAVGDILELTCAASRYTYTENLKIILFLWDQFASINVKNLKIIKSVTNYTSRITLTINSATCEYNGIYVCVSNKLTSNAQERIYKEVIVHDLLPPKITKTNMIGTELKVKAEQPMKLFCEVEGIPKPNVMWQKNKQTWKLNANDDHIKFSQDNTHVSFEYLDEDDAGEYSCRAENRIGQVTKTIILTVTHEDLTPTILIVMCVVVVIVLIIMLIALKITIQNGKKLYL